MTEKKQHVDFCRKVLLRKNLDRMAGEGPVYLPFCGDGDLAAELWNDRPLLGIDNDPERVGTFNPDRQMAFTFDADNPGLYAQLLDRPWAIADFDAYGLSTLVGDRRDPIGWSSTSQMASASRSRGTMSGPARTASGRSSRTCPRCGSGSTSTCPGTSTPG